MEALLAHYTGRHTGQDVEQLRRDTARDLVLTATAVEYGLVDEVLPSRKHRAAA